jgi:diacylglycerol kinase (ATP)
VKRYAGHTPVVLLNPGAGGGRAESKWEAVAPAISSLSDHLRIQLDTEGRWRDSIARLCRQGARTFIAAGGDGTAGALIDCLVKMDRPFPLNALTVGAIGLGSSNDLHKPFRKVFRGIPLRVGPDTIARDVGRARVIHENGFEEVRHFVVSASIGLTAEANGFFSEGNRLQSWLRKRWTSGAILYATCRTLALFRNRPVFFENLRSVPSTCHLTNLTVAKSEWVSGHFRYGTTVAPDDGLLLISLCEGMTRRQVVRVLLGLSRGRFDSGRGRHQCSGSCLSVRMARPDLIELDGEILRGSRVSFDLLPERINLLS